MHRLFLMAAFAAASAACTSTSAPNVTHAWNANDKSSSEYRFDNFACLDRANTNERDLTMNDERFDDYKSCMLDRGYALRAY
ncbi:MAG: hypothetical protein GWP50_05020 [Proteobacteria bacterium]|nr:hypothetical protein [Pseudomonadota bacterium]